MGQEIIEDGTERKPLLDEVEEANSPVTAVALLSVSVAVCASFAYGCANGFSSPAMASIMEELNLSVADYSLSGSLLTFGGMIGAIFSGSIASALGRKLTLCLSHVLCISGWLAIAFAKDYWWLDTGRFSSGIGIGFISFVVPTYIAEISPKQCRGGFTFSLQLLLNFGSAVTYIIGNLVHWRTLAFLNILPCLTGIIGLFFIPESPRWLAQKGREKEAETALQRLRGKKAEVSIEAPYIQATVETLERKSSILDLFDKKYAHAITVGVGLMFFQQFSGINGVAYYVSNIIKQSGFPTKIGTTILSLVIIPKPLLGLILVDTWGRRPLLLASAFGMLISCILIGICFVLQGYHYLPEITPLVAFISIVMYTVMFAIGLGGVPWIIMAELFPMNVKKSAGSLVTFTNWSTSLIVTYTFNFMLEWSLSGTFFIFGAICGGSVLFVWLLVPETKGKTLEEIQK